MTPNEAGAAQLRALGGEVALFSAGGVEAKVYGIPAGTEVTQHVHDYDHLSILISGKVGLFINDSTVPVIYEGLNFIEIKAGQRHKVVAGFDSLWVCLHNSDRLDV